MERRYGSAMKICLKYLLLGLASSAVTLGQTPPQAPPSIPQFHVESQIVILDTVVVDRKGNIVTNLTRDDFTVYENGKQQAISNFEAPSVRPVIPEGPGKDRNGHEDWGASPLAMIVVDEMDTPFSEMVYARGCVERYLKHQPEKLIEPTILLWLNDYGFHPVTGFTRDRNVLLNALAKHPASLPSKLQRGSDAEQIAASLAALQQAALFSRGQPGKKEIIWVGRSFPSVDPTNLEGNQRDLLSRALRSTVDLLLASRVSLYVIDPTITESAINDDVNQDSDTIAPLAATQITDPFSAKFNINLFVAQTGGKYFWGYNDLDRQVDQTMQRGSGYYTLSYVPNPPIHDGSYRQIDIRLSDPNLIVKTKRGYYSENSNPPQPTKQSEKTDRQELAFDLYEASITGMQYTGLGLHVESCERDPNTIGTTCSIVVDTGSLTFSPAAKGNEQTTLIAVLSSLNAKGKLVNDTVERLTLAIPEEQMARVDTGFSKLHLHTIVPDGTKTVRVVLRDASGRIGTADVDSAAVPKLIASPAAMALKKHRK